jgi:dihydrofolate reductase
MSRLVVTNSLSLDGVMQAPARADEDRRGGFERGGWATPYFDVVMGEVMSGRIAPGGSLLLGRRTYEQMATVWPHMPEDNPFTKVMNERRKHVASRTLEGPLGWTNATLLEGDTLEAVVRLKREAEGDIGILGSGELIQSLLPHGLIDSFVLSIHPLLLGSGRRLFADDGQFAALKLVDATPTTTGVLIATYEPARAAD